MKLSRVLFLLALVALLPACVSSTRYTKFRSANLRGETIAEWTARGLYYRTATGYHITAVERVSGPPFPHESRYPHGRSTTVTGPAIEHWSVEKPAWLDEEFAGEDNAAYLGK